MAGELIENVRVQRQLTYFSGLVVVVVVVVVVLVMESTQTPPPLNTVHLYVYNLNQRTCIAKCNMSLYVSVCGRQKCGEISENIKLRTSYIYMYIYIYTI